MICWSRVAETRRRPSGGCESCRKNRGKPRVVVTDKLRVYAAAKRETMLGVEAFTTKISTTGPRIPIS